MTGPGERGIIWENVRDREREWERRERERIKRVK